jgi:hypothetical protein
VTVEKGKSIFLISRLWIDPMENQHLAAMGYSPVGFVSTKEEADTIVESGGFADRSTCWAMDGTERNLKFDEIPEYAQKLDEGD